MGKEVTFHTPVEGALITLTDMALFQELVLFVGEEYWGAGAGASVLKFTEGDKWGYLEIIFSQFVEGFYFLHRGGLREYASYNAKLPNNTLEIYVGGNPILLSQRFFVSRADAVRVVTDFFHTGEASPHISWASTEELDWDFGHS